MNEEFISLFLFIFLHCKTHLKSFLSSVLFKIFNKEVPTFGIIHIYFRHVHMWNILRMEKVEKC